MISVSFISYVLSSYKLYYKIQILFSLPLGGLFLTEKNPATKDCLLRTYLENLDVLWSLEVVTGIFRVHTLNWGFFEGGR